MKTLAKFEVYKDAAKEWRWRLVAPNGRIIADSGEGYNRKGMVVTSLRRFLLHATTATWPPELTLPIKRWVPAKRKLVKK